MIENTQSWVTYLGTSFAIFNYMDSFNKITLISFLVILTPICGGAQIEGISISGNALDQYSVPMGMQRVPRGCVEYFLNERTGSSAPNFANFYNCDQFELTDEQKDDFIIKAGKDPAYTVERAESPKSEINKIEPEEEFNFSSAASQCNSAANKAKWACEGGAIAGQAMNMLSAFQNAKQINNLHQACEAAKGISKTGIFTNSATASSCVYFQTRCMNKCKIPETVTISAINQRQALALREKQMECSNYTEQVAQSVLSSLQSAAAFGQSKVCADNTSDDDNPFETPECLKAENQQDPNKCPAMACLMPQNTQHARCKTEFPPGFCEDPANSGAQFCICMQNPNDPSCPGIPSIAGQGLPPIDPSTGLPFPNTPTSQNPFGGAEFDDLNFDGPLEEAALDLPQGNASAATNGIPGGGGGGGLGSSGGGAGGFTADQQGGKGGDDGISTDILGGTASGGAEAAALSTYGSGGGGNGNSAFGSRRFDPKKFNLKALLPKGKKPNGRLPASASTNDGVTGSNGPSIFQKVTRRYGIVRPQLLP